MKQSTHWSRHSSYHWVRVDLHLIRSWKYSLPKYLHESWGYFREIQFLTRGNGIRYRSTWMLPPPLNHLELTDSHHHSTHSITKNTCYTPSNYCFDSGVTWMGNCIPLNCCTYCSSSLDWITDSNCPPWSLTAPSEVVLLGPTESQSPRAFSWPQDPSPQSPQPVDVYAYPQPSLSIAPAALLLYTPWVRDTSDATCLACLMSPDGLNGVITPQRCSSLSEVNPSPAIVPPPFWAHCQAL